MIYAFGDCRLDVGARELRRGERIVRLEPQVFDLLRVLIESRERVVSRDELIERIWGGRVVSDAAVSSRIKSARQAIGDDGERQEMIRTLHGVGFRFVAAVAPAPLAATACATALPPGEPEPPCSRPSIAVLPFLLIGISGRYAGIADALPHDLIVELSRLRWLTVIARGWTFQLRGADATPERVKAALGVRYALTGVVEVEGVRLRVIVEVSDTDSGAVVWGEVYRSQLEAVHEIRAEIARAVVAALELQIPLAEARRALSAPANLDAWAAYHLGIAQMYRFDREGAERAAALFEQAIAREPGFARAHAGLSFAHFEGAFLRFAADRAAATERARRCAEASLALDPLDPFCNLVMGRAAWLSGDLEGALPWLDRAVELNPNYAQGKYSSAWTRTLLGEGGEGQALVDAAVALSPLDPLLYGMLGVRAFSHMVLDEPAEAARWGERAARAPRAHPLIELVAAVGHGLNGDEERARKWMESALTRRPGLRRQDFFEAFPFRDAATYARVDRVLRRLAS
jgi:TolB-like protein